MPWDAQSCRRVYDHKRRRTELVRGGSYGSYGWLACVTSDVDGLIFVVAMQCMEAGTELRKVTKAYLLSGTDMA